MKIKLFFREPLEITSNPAPGVLIKRNGEAEQFITLATFESFSSRENSLTFETNGFRLEHNALWLEIPETITTVVFAFSSQVLEKVVLSGGTITFVVQ